MDKSCKEIKDENVKLNAQVVALKDALREINTHLLDMNNYSPISRIGKALEVIKKSEGLLK